MGRPAMVAATFAGQKPRHLLVSRARRHAPVRAVELADWPLAFGGSACADGPVDGIDYLVWVIDGDDQSVESLGGVQRDDDSTLVP